MTVAEEPGLYGGSVWEKMMCLGGEEEPPTKYNGAWEFSSSGPGHDGVE